YLACEAGFVAPQSVERRAALEPRSCLRDHHFHAIVMRRAGGMIEGSKLKDIVFEAGKAIEAEVRVNDLLRGLVLHSGPGIEVSQERLGEVVIGFHFFGLQDDME